MMSVFKAFINKKNNISIMIAAVLCGVVLTLMHINARDILTLENAFLCARDGYVELGRSEYHADASISTINIVIILTMVLSAFCEDLNIAKSFVFIRISNKQKWFALKFLQLFAHCLLFAVVYNASIMLALTLLGFKAESIIVTINYLVFGIVAHAVTTIFFSLIGSILSFFIKPHIAAGFVLALFEVWIFISNYIPVEISQYNLIMNYFVSWHTYYSVNIGYYSFPTWTYYAALCFIVGVELIIANKIIKKKDFI